jgi:hypothetical protein
VDGHVIPERQELRAEVRGGDGFGEVTFVLARASRPGQFELLGTADSPPYRIYWRPPSDLAPGELLSFIATFSDLRGHQASAEIDRLRVAPSDLSFGIRGAGVPFFTRQPAPVETAAAGKSVTLAVAASGTEPLEFSWLHDGEEVPGATGATLVIRQLDPTAAGHYRALVHNREGTVISRDIEVRGGP